MDSKLKNLISEIDRSKELMGLQIIMESDFSKKFVYPSNGKKVMITSPYGMRFNPVTKKYTMHHGLDLRAKQGSNILAIADGVVTTAVFTSGGCGGTLRIDHGTIDGKKIHSRFCHVSEFLFKVGDEVKQGQIVAKSGGTPGTKGDGTTNGAHIHFEFGINGSAVDPKQYYDEMSEWTGTPIEPEKSVESEKQSTNDSFEDEGGFNFGSDYDEGDTFNLEGSFTEKAKEKGSDVLDWAKDTYDDLSGKYSDWKGNEKFAGLSGIQKTFADALRKLTQF
jgi:hypothetical protein